MKAIQRVIGQFRGIKVLGCMLILRFLV